MSGYIGVRCPVCRKKFVEGDDIVVCPVCGAPHHRDCYEMEGQCAFEDEHITGKTWKPEPEESSDFCINPQDGERWHGTEQQARTCAYCGARNPKDNLFCCSCGHRLVDAPSGQQNIPPGAPHTRYMPDPTVAVYGGLSPTDKIDEFNAKEVAAYVGKSSHYYLPRFKTQSEGQKSFNFSLSAFLFSFLYFFYRKMYKVGAIVLALTLILSLPSVLYTKTMFPIIVKEALSTSQMENMGIDQTKLDISSKDLVNSKKYENWNIYTNILSTVLRLLLGIFSCNLYYRHTIKEMKKIKREYSANGLSQGVGIVQAENILKEKGGVNTALVTVMIIVFLILSIVSVGAGMFRLMS